LNSESGVATHFVPSGEMNDLENELRTSKTESEVDKILSKRNSKPSDYRSELLSNKSLIHKIFSQTNVEQIMDSLIQSSNQSEFITRTLSTLQSVSPTSLKVIRQQLHLGSKLSYEECFKMEYRISQAYMVCCYFYRTNSFFLILFFFFFPIFF
jgi:enoyl-CoA hydratase